MSILKIRKSVDQPPLWEPPVLDPETPAQQKASTGKKGALRGNDAAFQPDPMDFDPYDVFLLPEKKSPTGFDLAMKVLVACLTGVLLLGGSYSLYQYSGGFGAGGDRDRPFAYFEIKAIDAVGHPVVGAMVEGEEKYGVTDSFGEWRRFMRVPLGSTFRIKITKKTRDGLLIADKNIAIPPELPRSGDLEIKQTVSVDYRKPGQVVATKNTAPTPAGKKAVALSQLEKDAPHQPTPRYDRIWFEVVPADTVTRAADARSQKFLQRNVMKALKQRVVQLGLRLDPQSEWVLQLRHLSTRGKAPQEGLVHVTSSMSGPVASPPFTFLRNYKETPMETARGILWAATLHTDNQYTVRPYGERWAVESLAKAGLWREKSETLVINGNKDLFEIDKIGPVGGAGLLLKESSVPPCAAPAPCIVKRAGLDHRPPQAGWTSLHLKVVGNRSPDLEVYVSGFAARHIAPGSFVYWGEDGGSANVTVVQNGRMIHRQRLAAPKDGPARLVVGTKTLSRKN